MRNPSTLTTACAVLLAALLLLAGCTLPGGKSTPAPTTVPTPVPTPVPVSPEATVPSGAACGVTNCHGLDVTCGSTPPMACTMEYQIGDKCREYARCDGSSGTCRLVIEAKYTACKACVEQCQIAAGPDSLAAFSCAEKC